MEGDSSPIAARGGRPVAFPTDPCGPESLPPVPPQSTWHCWLLQPWDTEPDVQHRLHDVADIIVHGCSFNLPQTLGTVEVRHLPCISVGLVVQEPHGLLSSIPARPMFVAVDVPDYGKHTCARPIDPAANEQQVRECIRARSPHTFHVVVETGSKVRSSVFLSARWVMVPNLRKVSLVPVSIPSFSHRQPLNDDPGLKQEQLETTATCSPTLARKGPSPACMASAGSDVLRCSSGSDSRDAPIKTEVKTENTRDKKLFVGAATGPEPSSTRVMFGTEGKTHQAFVFSVIRPSTFDDGRCGIRFAVLPALAKLLQSLHALATMSPDRDSLKGSRRTFLGASSLLAEYSVQCVLGPPCPPWVSSSEWNTLRTRRGPSGEGKRSSNLPPRFTDTILESMLYGFMATLALDANRVPLGKRLSLCNTFPSIHTLRQRVDAALLPLAALVREIDANGGGLEDLLSEEFSKGLQGCWARKVIQMARVGERAVFQAAQELVVKCGGELVVPSARPPEVAVSNSADERSLDTVNCRRPVLAPKEEHIDRYHPSPPVCLVRWPQEGGGLVPTLHPPGDHLTSGVTVCGADWNVDPACRLAASAVWKRMFAECELVDPAACAHPQSVMTVSFLHGVTGEMRCAKHRPGHGTADEADVPLQPRGWSWVGLRPRTDQVGEQAGHAAVGSHVDVGGISPGSPVWLRCQRSGLVTPEWWGYRCHMPCAHPGVRGTTAEDGTLLAGVVPYTKTYVQDGARSAADESAQPGTYVPWPWCWVWTAEGTEPRVCRVCRAEAEASECEPPPTMTTTKLEFQPFSPSCTPPSLLAPELGGVFWWFLRTEAICSEEVYWPPAVIRACLRLPPTSGLCAAPAPAATDGSTSLALAEIHNLTGKVRQWGWSPAIPLPTGFRFVVVAPPPPTPDVLDKTAARVAAPGEVRVQDPTGMLHFPYTLPFQLGCMLSDRYRLCLFPLHAKTHKPVLKLLPADAAAWMKSLDSHEDNTAPCSTLGVCERGAVGVGGVTGPPPVWISPPHGHPVAWNSAFVWSDTFAVVDLEQCGFRWPLQPGEAVRQGRRLATETKGGVPPHLVSVCHAEVVEPSFGSSVPVTRPNGHLVQIVDTLTDSRGGGCVTYRVPGTCEVPFCTATKRSWDPPCKQGAVLCSGHALHMTPMFQ